MAVPAIGFFIALRKSCLKPGTHQESWQMRGLWVYALGSGLIKRDGRCRIQAKSRCLFVRRQYLKVLARAKRLRDEA